MPLVPAICTQCGAQIEVDDTHEAGICKHCGTAFITEKAINNFNINNTISIENASFNVSGVNIDNLLQRAHEFEKNGDYNKALEYFNRVLDENIDNAMARAGVERNSKVDIGGVILSKENGEIIINLLKKGLKVQSIKELRVMTGLGLKEAKDAIDFYVSQNPQVSNAINNYSGNNEVSSYSVNTKSSGCYIATCVYGSYDCPQVWTLRRYRDFNLDATWYGRVFIKFYYALSPTLVKWFGNQKWFKTFWKKSLDVMVAKLNQKGIEDTQYHDKY